MKLEGEQLLLRAWLRNTDKHGLQTAAEAIVQRAKQAGLAGATMLRGTLGLDCRGQLLAGAGWSLVEHLPVIVEIVDSAGRLLPFLEELGELLDEGIVTLERAHVLVYRHTAARAAAYESHLEVPARVADLATVPRGEEFAIMKLSEDGQLVRVFIGESDTFNGEPLFRAIVLKARELGLAGATVLHGTMGFGAASRVHTSRLLELSTDLPVLVEMVDSAERIESILPFLDECVDEGMITIESVRVLKYRHGQPSGGSEI